MICLSLIISSAFLLLAWDWSGWPWSWRSAALDIDQQSIKRNPAIKRHNKGNDGLSQVYPWNSFGIKHIWKLWKKNQLFNHLGGWRIWLAEYFCQSSCFYFCLHLWRYITDTKLNPWRYMADIPSRLKCSIMFVFSLQGGICIPVADTKSDKWPFSKVRWTSLTCAPTLWPTFLI